MLYVVKQGKEWINIPEDEITIGRKNYTMSDLEKYYRGILPYESFHYKASKYLCAMALDEVVEKTVYTNQADVDKVFFKVALQSCEKFLINWVNDWKEVYQQLAASKVPFRELILREGYLSLSEREYRNLYVETTKIKQFFTILNMQGAMRMMKHFTEYVLLSCFRSAHSVPDVYPFALKGKPVQEMPQPMLLLPAAI